MLVPRTNFFTIFKCHRVIRVSLIRFSERARNFIILIHSRLCVGGSHGLLINKATRHQLSMNCIFASPSLICFSLFFPFFSSNIPPPPHPTKPLPFCHKLVIILILAAYKATLDKGGGGGAGLGLRSDPIRTS